MIDLVKTMGHPSADFPGFWRVAWHGGGSSTLKIGKAHLAPEGAFDDQPSVPRRTLCGRRWRRSMEVIPNDYWTTGDCARCVSAARKSVTP